VRRGWVKCERGRNHRPYSNGIHAACGGHGSIFSSHEVEPPETPVRFNPPPLPSDARGRVAHRQGRPQTSCALRLRSPRKHSAGRSCKLQGPISKHIQGNGTRSRKGVTFNQRYRQISIEVTPADLEFLNRNKSVRFLA